MTFSSKCPNIYIYIYMLQNNFYEVFFNTLQMIIPTEKPEKMLHMELNTSEHQQKVASRLLVGVFVQLSLQRAR